MKLSCWFAFGLLFPLYGSAAAGTTIDFEEPEIDSPHESVDPPYVMNGVEFFIFTSQTTSSRKSCAMLWPGQRPSSATPIHRENPRLAVIVASKFS